ncbi:MAG: tetratricopeptide repeat protein [Candidatus Omnitrophica bacterium]|nr:tetratricopeptide repeat protein [Candidatus Omnitrophota bacterium]
MIKLTGLSLLISLFFLCGDSYGLEWKDLHEQADKTSLYSALESLKKKPDSLENLYILGLTYLNIHKNQEAGEVFSKILRLYPQTIEARWGLAEVWRRQHSLDKSEALLSEIIKANPDFSPAYISLAYLKYMRMDFKESVALAYKVIRQGEKKVDLSNYTRAYLLVGGGRGMLAHYGGPISKISNGTAVLPNLKKAEALQPDSPGVLFGLGSFYFLAPGLAGGDKEKAFGYLEKAIQQDPLFADAYVRLAQFYKYKGDNDKHKAYLDKAAQIDPQNGLLLDALNNKCKFVCLSDN